MKRDTLIRAGLAAGIVALMVLAPTPALAVQAPPPPVEPVQALPSTVVKMTQGRSGSWSVPDFLRAVTYENRPRSVATIPKPTIPLTAPQTISKAGGVAMFGFQGGWMLGQAGLSLYAAATGTTYDNVYCSQSPIYQGVTAAFAFNLGQPDCTVPVNNPNGDQTPSYSVGPVTVSSTWGSWTTSGKTTNTDVYCYAGTLAAGQRVVFSGTASTSPNTNGVRWGSASSCTPWPASLVASVIVPTAGTVSFRLLNASGQTVANSVANSPNPERTLSCKIKWSDGTLTVASGDKYFEESGVPLGSSGFGCEQAYVSKPGAGPDLLPDEITVESDPGNGGSKTEISKQQIPDYDADEKKGLDPGDGSGLKLWKITTAGKASCMTWAADCKDWWTKTNSGTSQPPGETFRCEWGGQWVKLAECGVYRRTFDDTETDTGKITDPETGETTDWTTVVEGDMNTGLTPGQRCLTEWTQIVNPIEFVLQPVKCALVWAFVPSPPKLEAFGTKLDQKWKQSTPGQLATAFAGIGLAFEALGDGNCSGIPIQLPTSINPNGTPDTETEHFMAACSGILQPVAAATYWIMTVSIAILGAVAIKLQLDRFVGNT